MKIPESFITGSWPGAARAAVSLTYDDGNENNLDQAIPDLEAHGFRGSFYLSGGSPRVEKRLGCWKAAFERGHEIGNHSVRHPCRTDAYPARPAWITHPLEDYSPASISAEVSEAADWLDRFIGKDPHRSYAYPCGHTAIGSPPDEEGYLKAVASRHAFGRVYQEAGAKWSGDVGLIRPGKVSNLKLAGLAAHNHEQDFFAHAFQEALDTAGWLILVFHGVGGPTHEVGRELHRWIIEQLAAGPFWVAPLRDVALHLSPANEN